MPTLRHTQVQTALGELTLVADGDELIGIYFPGHWHLPKASTFGVHVNATEDELFSQTKAQIDEYLNGERQSFDVPVRTDGNQFSEQVWAMLKEIPYGSTTTYGALAERLGNRHLAQRVGQAVGWNPISIVIPCHRVVGADGSLTGYAGGLERKQRLLELEEPDEAAVSRLF